MTGMQRKKQKRDRAKRFTEDGLPRDAKDWTEADWRTLYEALEKINRDIAARHKEKQCPTSQ